MSLQNTWRLGEAVVGTPLALELKLLLIPLLEPLIVSHFLALLLDLFLLELVPHLADSGLVHAWALQKRNFLAKLAKLCLVVGDGVSQLSDAFLCEFLHQRLDRC